MIADSSSGTNTVDNDNTSTWYCDSATTYEYEYKEKEPEEFIDLEEREWVRRNWKDIQKRHHFHQSKWGHNKPRHR